MSILSFCRAPADFSVALLGFGRANRAVLEWLAARGGRATVYTDGEISEEDFQRYGCALTLGGGLNAEIGEEILVRSPGVRPDLPAITRALSRGAYLTSETELLTALAPCRVIGVTGSDGKTTTATLAAALLRAAGRRVWLGGNIGTPLLPRVGEMKGEDMAVLELSSFQLMTRHTPPSAAIITNITPNHLNWHVDMAEYEAAKGNIFAKGTRLVLNAENAVTARIGVARREGQTLFFSATEKNAHFATALLPHAGAIYAVGDTVFVRENGKERAFRCLDAYRLAGRHNLENLLAAIGATAPFLREEAPQKALCDFLGVAHRLQYVGEVLGVKYYNSSIDTSPTRTAAALSALGGTPLVIAGGRGKGISFAPLAEALRRHAKAVYLYGEAAGEIAAALGGFPHKIFSRFADAFSAAARDAAAGDTVLLSPGCTAFGEFRDFEERGNAFCRLVEALKIRE